jgi:hypothetical protein
MGTGRERQQRWRQWKREQRKWQGTAEGRQQTRGRGRGNSGSLIGLQDPEFTRAGVNSVKALSLSQADS